MGRTRAWINPLIFFPAEEQSPQSHPEAITSEEIFHWISAPEEFAVDKVVSRYKKITRKEDRKKNAILPADMKILDRIVWPLKAAKINFMLANYAGSLASAGMSVEMAAILLFEISVHNKSTASMKFFEGLGQEKRVKHLRKLELIPESIHHKFSLVREKRKVYLHFLSGEWENIIEDAEAAYHAAEDVVQFIIGPQDIKDGGLVLRSDLLAYLKRTGTYEE